MGCGASHPAPPGPERSLLPMGRQPDLTALKRIDEHALMTPPEVTQSLQSLAGHLSSSAKTELEKIRAVYTWVTAYIRFDSGAERPASQPMSASDAEAVLRSRRAGGADFADIAWNLFRLSGIECQRLSGHAKDFGYSPLKPLTPDTRPNHAWNAVRADGRWGLVDCALGSGCLDEAGKFTRRHSDFYFLPSPQIFLNDHLPLVNSKVEAGKQWQLVAKPIDLATFYGKVRKREACYRLGVQPKSHSGAIIKAGSGGTVKLVFQTLKQPVTHFSATFYSVKNGERCRSSLAASVVDRRAKEVSVTGRLPTAGGAFWELRVRAATGEGSSAGQQWLLSYFICTDQLTPGVEPFPEFDGFYGARLDPHRFGFKQQLDTGHPVGGFWIVAETGELSLKLPIYMPVRATAELKFAKALDQQQTGSCMLEMDYLYITVHIRMSRVGYYRLTLLCKDIYDVSEQFFELANFLIHCRNSLARLRPFPRTWNLRHQIRLASHTEESIRVDQEVALRFQAQGKPIKLFNARFVHPRTGRRLGGRNLIVVLDRLGREATVVARPPEAGVFWELLVFANTDEQTKSSDVIASYQILASQASTANPFPDFDGFYGAARNPEDYGFVAETFGSSSGFWLRSEGSGGLELRLPTRCPVDAIAVLSPAQADPDVTISLPGQQQQQQQLCSLEATGNLLKIRANVRRSGFHRLTLRCARLSKSLSSNAKKNRKSLLTNKSAADDDEEESQEEDVFYVELANFLVECTLNPPLRSNWG